MQTIFDEIDRLKQEFDVCKSSSFEAVKKFKGVYRVEWTYHSNAIEGNTLTLQETKAVLEGQTIERKTWREHLEIINHSEAIDYVEEIVEKEIPLSEKVIKDLHSLILRNIDDRNRGRYRTINVHIAGSQHKPIHHLKVPENIEAMLSWFNQEQNRLHPVELAAVLHFKFVYIHPFVDGNGRTARLLMNMVLMQKGYPPVILKSDPSAKVAYYQALEKASITGELTPLILIIAKEEKESLTRFLHMLN